MSREQRELPLTCVSYGAGWWQIKEVPELPEKKVWILSEARGRQWSNTGSFVLQEEESVSNFEMYWRLQLKGQCNIPGRNSKGPVKA